jgi:aminoglycoside phosphotransferase (APT) family kinase protein
MSWDGWWNVCSRVMAQPVSDSELIEALGGQLDGHEIVALERRPYRYATSAPLEEIRVRTDDGTETLLILKDLLRDRLLCEARASKPEFLHEPRRELETYRRVLAPAGVGPRAFAVVDDARDGRQWLLLEKVPGVELWQVGELSIWGQVAAWLGAFHAHFGDRLAAVREANPHLLQHSPASYRTWCDRARAALLESADLRAPDLIEVLDGYDEVVETLASLPRTFVHGELYPSNVLVVVAEGSVGVYPVDWEMAGIGPGLVDVAALVGGWDAPERERLEAAYLQGLTDAGGLRPGKEDLKAGVSSCRLYLALQWLGWARGWQPPREHAHDWLGEALLASRELGRA